MTEITAARGMRALIVCLNQSRFHNPSPGYPASLESIIAVSDCNPSFAKKDTFTGYELRYIPRHPTGTTETAGFELVATPRGFKRTGLEPILSDDSGAIAELSGWSASVPKPQLLPLFDDGSTLALVAAAKDFATQDQNHRPPRTFDDLVGPSSVLSSHGPHGKLGTKFQSGYFSLEYFPPTVEGSNQFSIAETCTFYGMECLRNFLFESSGDIHYTTEPRPATHDDRLVSAACLTQAKCPGLIWPNP